MKRLMAAGMMAGMLLGAACGGGARPAAVAPTAGDSPTAVATAAPAAEERAATITAVCDSAYLPAVLDLINGAEERLTIVHFEFVYGTATRAVQEALGAAVRRGVTVTMVLDEESAKTQRSIGFLTELGVKAKLDGTETRTHTKLVVADGRRVLFGSTNFSTASMQLNHETNLLVDDARLGAAAEQYAAALGRDATASVELAPAELTGLTVYFDRGFEQPLLALLAGARETIEVQMYGTRYYPRDPHSPSTAVLQALADAAQRGVTVRVLLEQGEGGGEMTEQLNRETAAFLAAHGVTVRFDPREVISHAKLVLVDDRATVGSMNWGFGGFRQYHEMNSIVSDPAPVTALRAYFAGLWAAGEPYRP
ncbi:MAG TPA: phospholipase D-like domain-containing protein [bacterium]|nr:phospholipase D-like domain-containing protein [bacterium]